MEKTVEELTVIGEHPLWQRNANQAMRLTTTDAYYSVGEKRLEKYFHLFQVFLSFKWGFQIQSATFTPLKNGRGRIERLLAQKEKVDTASETEFYTFKISYTYE